MFSVNNLTKEYRNKKHTTYALNSVSFDLPDKGLVFIIGKSGSGKTTLLNILSGLDKATSGEVVFMDKAFSNFTRADFDAYRNTSVGFVFQNSCLMEGLTVKENLDLVLGLQGKADFKLIDKTLDGMEIKDLADRKPSELSAGQLQRAAIARALIKNPEVIFADEPTGNLDSKTSKTVLEIFKNLSLHRLVVVVSHNVDDAKNYGDRIIELADGIVVSDLEKDKNFNDDLKIDGDRASVPSSRPLSIRETAKLSQVISSNKGNVFIGINPYSYHRSTYKHQRKPIMLRKARLDFKAILTYSIKNIPIVSSIFTIVIVSVIAVLLGVCQAFSTFDGVSQIAAARKNSYQTYSLITKTKTTSEPLPSKETSLPMSKEEIEKIEEASNGNSYLMYSTGIPMVGYVESTILKGNYPTFNDLSKGKGYITFSNGTIVADIDFLKRNFASDDGELKVLSGEIKDNSGGVIITDYIADSLIKHHTKRGSYFYSSYDRITDGPPVCYRIKVDAIIDTGYKENPQIMALINGLENDTNFDYSPYAKEIDYIINCLSCLYSINVNFFTSYVNYRLDNIRECDSQFDVNIVEMSGVDGSINGGDLVIRYNYLFYRTNIEAGTVLISSDYYNELFGTNYSSINNSDFVPNKNKIHLKVYDIYCNRIIDKEYPISVLDYTGRNRIMIGVKSIKDGDQITFVEGVASDIAVAGVVTEVKDNESLTMFLRNYQTNDSDIYKEYNRIYDSNGGTAIYEEGERTYAIERTYFVSQYFVRLFKFIVIALFVLIIIKQSSSSLSLILRKKRDIGIMRSMGAKSWSVALIYVASLIEIGLITLVFTAVIYFFMVRLADNIFREALYLFNKNVFMKQIEIISFSWKYLLTDTGTVLLTIILSSIIPFLSISKIDPIKILRSKE